MEIGIGMGIGMGWDEGFTFGIGMGWDEVTISGSGWDRDGDFIKTHSSNVHYTLYIMYNDTCKWSNSISIP